MSDDRWRLQNDDAEKLIGDSPYLCALIKLIFVLDIPALKFKNSRQTAC